jgi:hypothetical protein
MGDRAWAAFGNVLRLFSVMLFLGAAGAAIGTYELAQRGPQNLVPFGVGIVVAALVFAVLFWLAKGPLVAGNGVVRVLVGLYMLLWCFSSLGFALVIIGVVYFFTGEPETYRGIFNAAPPKQPTFTPPHNWRATGLVGPSGAMLYSNAEQEAAVGVFDSWLPVQVLDKRAGLAHVVAATGQRGWIDERTLRETTAAA